MKQFEFVMGGKDGVEIRSRRVHANEWCSPNRVCCRCHQDRNLFFEHDQHSANGRPSRHQSLVLQGDAFEESVGNHSRFSICSPLSPKAGESGARTWGTPRRRLLVRQLLKYRDYTCAVKGAGSLRVKVPPGNWVRSTRKQSKRQPRQRSCRSFRWKGSLGDSASVQAIT